VDGSRARKRKREETEGNSALHIAYGGAVSARAQAVLDAAEHDAEVTVGCAADDVPDSSPLDAAVS
jgi:hypothetical protein